MCKATDCVTAVVSVKITAGMRIRYYIIIVVCGELLLFVFFCRLFWTCVTGHRRGREKLAGDVSFCFF